MDLRLNAHKLGPSLGKKIPNTTFCIGFFWATRYLNLVFLIQFPLWKLKKAFKNGVLYHGENFNRGPKYDPPILEPALLLVIGDLTWRTCWVVCCSLGRSLVSCQPSRCWCCCAMPKRSPAKRDFRDNGERKIKKSKEGASSSTSNVDEDLVRSFCLFSVMAHMISSPTF